MKGGLCEILVNLGKAACWVPSTLVHFCYHHKPESPGKRDSQLIPTEGPVGMCVFGGRFFGLMIAVE